MDISISPQGALVTDGDYYCTANPGALTETVMTSLEPIIREGLEKRLEIWFASVPGDANWMKTRYGKMPLANLVPRWSYPDKGLTVAGLLAELRIPPESLNLGTDPWIVISRIEPYKEENLVFLTFAQNECYPKVVGVAPSGVEADLVKGLWSQPRSRTPCRDTFLIGMAHPGAYHQAVSAIGVYDRTNVDHLNNMVHEWGEICSQGHRTDW